MRSRTLLLCSGFGILICSLPTPLLDGPRPLHGTANDRSCQVCHPGSANGLRASVHGVLLELPETSQQACTVCHGDLTEHRAIARGAVDRIPPVPAVAIQACNACHEGQDWPTSLGVHPTPPSSGVGHNEAGAPIPRLPEQDTGFDWSGLLTLGYRFVSRSGSRSRYRTDINLDPGLRLLEADVEAVGYGDSWADLLRLQMSGLEDPYTRASFEVSKDRSYRGYADYSENEVIYDTTGDFHEVTWESKRSLLELSAFLSEDVELFGSYSRLDKDGFWLVQRVGDRSLFPLTTVDDVRSPRRLGSDLADLGLNATSGATALSLAFEYLTERTVDSWSYMRPAQANPAFVESEDFTSEGTLRGPGARTSLSTRAGSWVLDFSGRYKNLDRRVGGLGTTTGFSFDEFTTDLTSNSEGDAETWLLDGTLTWEVSDEAALLFDLRWLDHEENMSLDQTADTTFPNIPLTVSATNTLDNRTSLEKLTGSVQVDYSPHRGVDLSLGYGFSRQDLEVPDLEAGDNDFLSGTVKDNGLLAGLQWRPDEHWTLRGYYEDFRQSGLQLHELAGDDAYRVDASLAYQASGNRIETFFKRRHAENDASLYNLDSETIGVNGNLHQEEGLDLFASYVFTDLDSRTLTNFYFDPDPNPVPTFVGFTGETHTVAGGLLLRPSDRVRWQLDLAYTDTHGSFDVSLMDWRAEVGVDVWAGGELGLLYRNIDYEDQSQVDDYDADIILLYWRQIIGAR